jgi:hypothetical protein
VDEETKFVPVTVSVKAPPPAVAKAGFSEVSVGAGLSTANVKEFEMPPPGDGLETVTGTDVPEAMSTAVI